MQQETPIDLGNLFETVKGTLAQNKKTLNDADTNNHDHGDNMVDTFEAITQAMKEKQGADPADQLSYASETVRQRKSGSAQVYAQGLSRASTEFQGKQVTPNNAMTLVQSLLGGGQAPAQQQQSGVGDLLGSLLGGATSQEAPAQEQQSGGGIDMSDILNAGMAFMSTKSRGGSTLEGIINAVVSSSAMGNSSHRSQSGSLVANTILQTIGGLTGNR